MSSTRTLVAGIGNVFLGDDGFGVEVARRLASRPAREDVCVVDFGIRGIDFSYALLEFDRVIIIDATPRGRAPGTLYVLEPDLEQIAGSAVNAVEAHGLVPEKALSAALAMGGGLRFVRIVGCEPSLVPAGDEVCVQLSPAVAAAVEGAMELVDDLVEAANA